MAGPSEPVPGQELLAVVVARRDRLQLAVDAEPRLALVRERLLGRLRAVLDLRHLERGHEPDAPDADVRQLDVRLLEAARVLALVDVVEVGAHLLDPVVVDRAGGDVDAQLVALAEVAAVADALEEDLVGREAVRLELGPRLLLQLLERALHRRRVELAQPLVDGRDVLVDHVSREQAHGCRHAGVAGHDHPRRAHLERDLRGEERAGAAFGDEGEVARVVALAHGVLLDRLHHRVGEDLHGAVGRLLDRHAELLRRALFEGRASEVGAQRHAASEEVLRREPAEVDHGVGGRRLGAAAPVGGGARVGAGRARPDAEDAAGDRRRRSSRRPHRSCPRRPSGSSPGTARPSCPAGASCAGGLPAPARCRPTSRPRRG